MPFRSCRRASSASWRAWPIAAISISAAISRASWSARATNWWSSLDAEGKPRHRGSGKDLSYFDDQTKERFIPHVIEPSAGADRATLAFLCEAYNEDEAPDENGKPTKRVFLKLHPRLAPIKAAVFPLVKKDGMPEIAREIYKTLKPHMTVFYDEKGAVGRRYRRQDEVGTPFCITVDGQTLSRRHGHDPRPRHAAAMAGAQGRVSGRGNRAADGVNDLCTARCCSCGAAAKGRCVMR